MCDSDECRLKSFGLEHDKPTNFVESAIGGPSLLYVVYRLTIANFFCVAIIYSIANFSVPTMWPAYMSHWSFILITLNTILQAVCVTRHYYVIVKQERADTESQKMRPIYKVIWILQNITYVTAPIVTIVYWHINYDGQGVTLGNSYVHMANILYIVNSLYVLVDLLITAIPVRILHFTHALLFSTTYVLFSFGCWLAGGMGHRGEPFIFGILEHAYTKEPWIAVVWFVTMATAAVLTHCIVLVVYRLRQVVYRPCRTWVGNREDVDVMASEVRE